MWQMRVLLQVHIFLGAKEVCWYYISFNSLKYKFRCMSQYVNVNKQQIPYLLENFLNKNFKNIKFF